MEVFFPKNMEFLFTNQGASIEAIMLFFCLGIIGLMFAYEGFLYVKRLYYVFHPRKAYTLENASSSTLQEKPLVPIALVLPDLPLDSSSEIPTLTDIHTPTEEGWGIPASPTVAEILSQDEAQKEIETYIEAVEVVSPFLDEPLVTSATEDPIDLLEPETPTSSAASEPSLLPWDLSEALPRETIIAEKSWDSQTEEIHKEDPIDDTELIGEPPPDDTTVLADPGPTVGDMIQNPLSENPLPLRYENSRLSPEKREKITTILSTVQTLIARGHLEEARAAIINGLALDKDHRELNILMASLYERDSAYSKAEYIFKDLARIYPDDAEILNHLATSLAMQHRYEVSYELYKKVLTLSGENEEILYTLTHLASELSLPEEVYEYGRSYLKQYPRNPEILWLYAQSLISRWERKEAIETLIKLKNLTPYNQEIVDLIGKLVTEEELAGNFGGEK